jgi:phenylpropionate dioxygenase-like ring-hydroxylating dioxygenase large terminal subunit
LAQDGLGENRFRVYVYNRHDDGTPPKKSDELPPGPTNQFHLEFRFPNIWENHLSNAARIVVEFAPVDETNTVLYVRFYQSFVRLPVLRQLVCLASKPMNRKILGQDRRVVVTQRPPASGLSIGENLFQADGPILECRRRREALIRIHAAKTAGPA